MIPQGPSRAAKGKTGRDTSHKKARRTPRAMANDAKSVGDDLTPVAASIGKARNRSIMTQQVKKRRNIKGPDHSAQISVGRDTDGIVGSQ